MVIEIDYSDLSSSSRSLDKAAKYCGEYASRLQRKVPDKLDNLTLGSSSYTSSASYFASAKIKSLESQQQKCLDVSGKIDSFIEEAKSTDKRVAGIMKSEGNDFRKASGLSYGWADGFMQATTRFTITEMNKDEFSRWISAQLRNVSENFNAWILDKKHWYACEGGKYVISTVFKIVGLAVAVLAAFAALVVALPIVLMAVSPALAAFFGITAAAALASWSGIVAVCTAVAACIAVADATVALINTVKASQMAETDPGWAARYADITTASDQLSKTCFDSKWKNTISNMGAVAINVVGTVCSIISIANLAVNGYKFFTNSYRANANWKRYFKIWDSNGKFSLKVTIKNWKKNWDSLNFAFNHDFQYTQWEGARKRNYAVYDALEKMKDSQSYKNVMKFFDKLKDGVQKFEKLAF